MINKKHFYAIIILFVIVAFVNGTMTTLSSDGMSVLVKNTISLKNIFGSLGVSYTIYLVIWRLIDKWVWKFIPHRFSRIYRVDGVWDGVINYEHQEIEGIKEVSVEIKQTFSDVKIQIKTNETISASLSTSWNYDASQLIYTYKTDTYTQFKDKNPDQYGGARIRINPDDLSKVVIEYWTDRKTNGYIYLTNNRKQSFKDTCYDLVA